MGWDDNKAVGHDLLLPAEVAAINDQLKRKMDHEFYVKIFESKFCGINQKHWSWPVERRGQ
jgi:hypothetical protein